MIVAEDRTAVSPQVRADQANRAVVRSEAELRAQTTKFVEMHDQVHKHEELVSSTLASLWAEED
eukprot:3702946-Pyramimonas_sp.AAC.1